MSVAKSKALRKVKYLFHHSQVSMTIHYALAHKRILVTRAPHQAAKLMRSLQTAGAIPLLFPCIDIVTITPPHELDTVCTQLHEYDWLIFSSSNMVWIMAQRLRELALQPVWQEIRIATVGRTTAQAVVQQLGTRPAFIPREQTGAELAASLPLDDGQNILLPQSQNNSNDIADRLRARGAAVHTLTGYQVVRGSPDVALLTQPIDGVIFTSPATSSSSCRTPICPTRMSSVSGRRPLPLPPNLALNASSCQTTIRWMDFCVVCRGISHIRNLDII
jgi:uroporphyrinogen-III synthase